MNVELKCLTRESWEKVSMCQSLTASLNIASFIEKKHTHAFESQAGDSLTAVAMVFWIWICNHFMRLIEKAVN